MDIHQFELDTAAEDNIESSSDRYYFFCDKDNILCAWMARKKKDKLLILAYKELKKGRMEIVDIKELLTIPESIQITSFGILLLNTQKGVLQLILESTHISLDATQATHPKINPWKEENQQFPGMEITDQLSIGTKKLTRYTTISKGYYGEPFQEESILCLSSKLNKVGDDINPAPLILIGSSRFDSQLNLVYRSKDDLFHIPLLNFSINYSHLSKKIQLLGWNRHQMQAIQIEYTEDNEVSMQIVDEKSKEFKDMAIKERSTLYSDHASRFVVLSDMDRPYRFFCIKAE
ncbi:MAG: hypothetical protein VXX91_07960 [Planctomycetota bacterium]|nr:hypothetical protein [Planctomycetota bacterium]